MNFQEKKKLLRRQKYQSKLKTLRKKPLNNNKTNNDTHNGVVLLNVVKFMTFDNNIHNLKTCML